MNPSVVQVTYQRNARNLAFHAEKRLETGEFLAKNAVYLGPTSLRKASASNVSTPSCSALASFEPAFSP